MGTRRRAGGVVITYSITSSFQGIIDMSLFEGNVYVQSSFESLTLTPREAMKVAQKLLYLALKDEDESKKAELYNILG